MADEKKDAVQTSVLQPLQQFFTESATLVKQCDKPNATEYKRIALVTGAGFLALGVMGYLVKLLHLPVNNLLVGGA